VKLFGYNILVTPYFRFITRPTRSRPVCPIEHATMSDDYELMIGPWYLVASKIKRAAA